MKKLMVLALFLTSSLAFANENAPSAYKLAQMIMTEEQWNKMVLTTSGDLKTSLGGQMKDPEGFSKSFVSFMNRTYSYKDMIDLQTGLLSKYYSPKEIEELIVFYRTPIGQKALRVMPEMMRDVNLELQTRMQSTLPQFIQELMEREIQRADSETPAAVPTKKPAKQNKKQ